MGPGGVLILAAVLGAVGGTLAWHLLRETFALPIFLRTNVRGADVPVAVGILLPVVLVAAASMLVLADSADWFDVATGPLLTTVLGATGFGMLGLLDDLAGDGSSRGFGGHLRALADRRLTTGAIKLFGGGAVALLVASTVSDERPARLLADAALIALAANLANLLDRAPGRVVKYSIVAAAPIAVVAGVDGRLAGAVVVLAAACALLLPDLREQMMQGDTGANVLGSTMGIAVVLTTAPSTRSIVLFVVLGLNLVSERVSFSRIIERTPPLRAFDNLGRLPADRDAR